MVIPIVDFSPIAVGVPDDAITEDGLQTVGHQVVRAFTDFGFCYVEHHGISQDLMDSCLNLSERFFSLPVDVKRLVLRGDGSTDYNGWTPLPNTPGLSMVLEAFDTEHPPECKETYNFSKACPPSKFPPEEKLPNFKTTNDRLIDDYHVLVRRLLLALGFGLNLKDPKEMTNFVKFLGMKGNESQARYAYYPKKPADEIKENELRCNEHTDFGLLTFLYQNGVPGLQVSTRKDEYVDVQPHDGAILINIGDTLERITGGIFHSARHRVLMNKDMAAYDRHSVIYFTVADDSAIVAAVCGDKERYSEKITSAEFLKRRFEDIFLRSKGVAENTKD